jgi:hypothetical protein
MRKEIFPSMKAFCFKCRQEMEVKDPKVSKMKNGNTGTIGICSFCGTKVFRVEKRQSLAQ